MKQTFSILSTNITIIWGCVRHSSKTLLNVTPCIDTAWLWNFQIEKTRHFLILVRNVRMKSRNIKKVYFFILNCIYQRNYWRLKIFKIYYQNLWLLVLLHEWVWKGSRVKTRSLVNGFISIILSLSQNLFKNMSIIL